MFEAQHIKWLEWAVSLCRRDIGSLREGDWLNLKEDLWEFATAPDSIRSSFLLSVTKEDFVEQMTVPLAIRIQEVIKRDLRSACYRANGDAAAIPPIYAKEVNFHCVSFSPDHAFFMLVADENPITAARSALARHLVGSFFTQRNIRECPECKNVFIIKRKPREDREHHCSLRCARNAATARYRDKKKEALKVKERARSKKRYREQRKKKHPHAPELKD